MEKGGGKLVPIRTDKQQRRGPTYVNGWLPAVDVVKRSSKYSAKAHGHPVLRRKDGNEGLLCRDQQLITPAAERGYTAAYSSKPLPKCKLRNSHISPASPPIATITRTRPKSCKHCVHLFTNGSPRLSGSIHSTLAYAKCRCHRPETTKLQSLRENHCSGATSSKHQATRLHKRVEFPHAAKETSQNMLPSLTKHLDPHSEQPPVIESSFSELTTSSSKLPTLKSGSVVSNGSSSQLCSSSQHRLTSSALLKKSSKLLHNSAAKLTSITEDNTTMKKRHVSFKLTDLWKYVSDEKREHLIKLFKKLDSDDDGHITWKQFLSYFNEMDLALKHYLHELYKVTSEATYFGKQEFVVCHGIHELLHCKKLPSSLYLNVDRYFLNTFVIPFLIKMSAMADNGQLNIQQLENNTLHTSSSSQVIFARTKLWTNSNEVSLLQLLSYAPAILSPV